jgi:hypothetical protein
MEKQTTIMIKPLNQNKMNKERNNQIIDEAYEYYLNNWSVEIDPNDGSVYNMEPIKIKPHTKEQFKYRLKTDTYFSNRWGSKGTIPIGPFSPRIAKLFQDELNKSK